MYYYDHSCYYDYGPAQWVIGRVYSKNSHQPRRGLSCGAARTAHSDPIPTYPIPFDPEMISIASSESSPSEPKGGGRLPDEYRTPLRSGPFASAERSVLGRVILTSGLQLRRRRVQVVVRARTKMCRRSMVKREEAVTHATPPSHRTSHPRRKTPPTK
jgi:hypothetical protein